MSAVPDPAGRTRRRQGAVAAGAVGLFLVVLGGVVAWGRQPAGAADPSRTAPAPSIVPSPMIVPNGGGRRFVPRHPFRIPGLPYLTPSPGTSPQVPAPQTSPDKGDGFHFVSVRP